MSIAVQAQGRSLLFDRGFTIGRRGRDGRAPDVALDDEYATVMHARVSERDGDWFVEDLGSTNGTWLNGRLVCGPVPLAKGDKVKIGRSVLIVVPVRG
jgi:pSer/pThr/pTyr-binding forkhead associated (FHA) protein